MLVAVALVAAAAAAAVAITARDRGGDRPAAAGAGQTTTTAREPTPCDTQLNPAAYYDEARTARVDTTAGSFDDTGHHGHDPDHAEMGEVEAVGLLLRALEMDDAGYKAWLASVAGPRDPSAPDDTGRGGHLGPHPWSALTDPDGCARLASEISRSREIALRYPKARDAKAAGWVPVTPYVAGIASHFMRFEYVDGEFDLDEPEMLLYDGIGDDANVLGLSYYILHPAETEPAQGFTGPNDHYHRHVGLCMRGTMVIADTTTTAEQCAAMGGVKADGSDGWMNHVWSVPGCESPWGLFSGINPVVDAALGSTSGRGSPCSSSKSRARFDLRPGSTAPS